jgi:serine/threonine protein kinase
MAVCTCGAEIAIGRTGVDLCPACLLRIALEPSLISALTDHAPARLLGPVGRGPHGTVYLAARPDDDPQIVTVKLIEVVTDGRLFCERVTSTAGVLDSLRHPGIGEFVQVGIAADGHAYVMATYIPGPSLRDYINRRAHVGARAALAGRLCSTIADLHERGLVHGSVKSTNIIVTESTDGPLPVLLDTGIVPAIEYGSGARDLASDTQDTRELHALLTVVLGDLSGLVEGTESVEALADLFAQRTDWA